MAVVILLPGSERGSGLSKITQRVGRGAGTQPFGLPELGPERAEMGRMLMAFKKSGLGLETTEHPAEAWSASCVLQLFPSLGWERTWLLSAQDCRWVPDQVSIPAVPLTSSPLYLVLYPEWFFSVCKEPCPPGDPAQASLRHISQDLSEELCRLRHSFPSLCVFDYSLLLLFCF